MASAAATETSAAASLLSAHMDATRAFQEPSATHASVSGTSRDMSSVSDAKASSSSAKGPFATAAAEVASPRVFSFFFFRIRRERAEGAAENRSVFEIRRRGVGARRRERGGGPRELSQETARAREDETTTVFLVPVAPVATAATAVGALHPGG